MDTFKHIFYSSEALITADKVAPIISVSRRKNAEVDITGALIYTGARFGQLIEGAPAAVDRLLETIVADTRHKDVRECIDETSTERWVSEWSMGYLTSAEFCRYVSALCTAHDDSGR
jgi:FAD-dependent sensor of blue light